MELSGVSQKVFLDRYALKDKQGNPIEKKPEEMWRRIAKAVSLVEKKENQKKWEKEFFWAMKDFKYVPGGRILAGAGSGFAVTFYNCFVIPSPKDSREGILETLKQMVEIMARGGGVGINLSSLRPRGARVKKVNGFSSGPVNWAELFSVATKDIIQQGGSRRGALMLMLWDWHPDIEEFITVKQDLSRINGANLSVCVSDKFMEAVEKDADWQLLFPDLDDKDYDEKWNGDLVEWQKMGKKVKVYKTVKARKIWDLIAQAAWRSAEPGVVFMERYNKLYNNWYWNRINCVNPCVTGDTLVNTTLGIKTMRQLYEENRPFNVVVNGKSYLSTAVKLTGIKPVFKLKTKEGYQLRLTADHKVVTLEGPKEAGKLKIGDKILISFGGGFGNEGSFEEGLVLGWLVGDGAIKKDVATLYFYQKEKKQLASHFALMVEKMVDGEQVVARPYPINPQYIEKEDKAVVESVRLWRIAKRFGLTFDNKYVVPEKVFQGSKEFQRGFLKGLFSSDGTVLGSLKKGVSVRLTSVSEELLQKVQILLLNFGIFSKIYKERRPSQKRLLPNGKGGKKWYQCQAYHELVISKESLLKFAYEIGFLQEEKQKKLQNMLLSYQRGPYKENFIATFSQLIPDGQEEVFDITVATIHRFSANGLLVLNCGEEGLPPWGVCNLGSINLSALVKGNDIDKKGRFDFKTLKKLVKIAVRFQDNVIDMDPYIFPGIRKTQLEGERRIGLGTMGLGDALIKLHLRYGSKESLKFIDKVYRTIRDVAYEVSAEIAKEKGAFPKFDKELYLKGEFIKQLPTPIKEKIKKYGIRNSLLLMQAPTGSTSLMANTTSGIEPVFEFEFIRKDRLGTHIIRHHLYEQWYKKHEKEIKEGKIKKPEWFVSTNELTPEDHVYVQATIQKYVDASISKTVNAPKNHTVEDVKKLYTLAYKLGCKGITYFREGSRQGVLERKTEEKKEEEEKPQDYIIKPRPMVVHGSTYRINTPVGVAFITINTNGGNPPEPLEVFINVGKAGTDVYAMAEGLGRMISTALRFSSHLPVEVRVREIINQLKDIGGARSYGFGKDKIRSLPDAVAKVLAMHYQINLNGNEQLKKDEKPKLVENVTQPSLTTFSVNEEKIFDICPACGEASFVHEEGCKKCYSCGYSECG
jgi:ribonucleoside-diphosphate reductase alpha chain